MLSTAPTGFGASALYGITPYLPKWTLVSTVTGSSTTATFSSLSGYARYKIVPVNLQFSNAVTPSLTINGDTGTNYSLWGIANAGTVYQSSGVSSVSLSPSGQVNTTGFRFVFEVEDVPTAGAKAFSYSMGALSGGSTNYVFNGAGLYSTTSTISSITITVSGGTFTAGTFYLYGASA